MSLREEGEEQAGSPLLTKEGVGGGEPQGILHLQADEGLELRAKNL
jgi:hypothetical protein